MNLNRNDKTLILIVAFIIIVVISLIVTLMYIWSSKEESKINAYSYPGFEEKVVAIYQKQIQILLKQNNTKLLSEKLDEEFLTKNNISRNDLTAINKYVTDKKLTTTGRAVIKNYTVSSNEDTGVVIYRFEYYNKYGNTRYVNLIETEPYLYTISFEAEYTPTSARKSIVDSYNGIKFEISLQESTTNSLKYNVKITNNGEETVEFDFNNVSSVEIKLDDGSKVKLSSVIATSKEDFVLTKNSYINQELFFSIPLDKQGNIKSVVFYNVLIGEKKVNLEIDF